MQYFPAMHDAHACFYCIFGICEPWSIDQDFELNLYFPHRKGHQYLEKFPKNHYLMEKRWNMFQKGGGGQNPILFHLSFFFFAKTKNDQDTLKHKINTYFFIFMGSWACLEWEWSKFLYQANFSKGSSQIKK